MTELRAEHLGAPLPSRAGPTTAERVAAAYAAALALETGESLLTASRTEPIATCSANLDTDAAASVDEIVARSARRAARVAAWEPMPTEDRSWVLEAAKSVPGVRDTFHLVDPETGNGLSVGFYDSREAISPAHAAIEHRAREIDWQDQPRPGPVSVTVYESASDVGGRGLHRRPPSN